MNKMVMINPAAFNIAAQRNACGVKNTFFDISKMNHNMDAFVTCNMQKYLGVAVSIEELGKVASALYVHAPTYGTRGRDTNYEDWKGPQLVNWLIRHNPEYITVL